MLIVLLAVAALQAPTAPPPAKLAEDGCSLVAEIDGKSQVVGPLEDLHVLDGPEALPIGVTPGGKLLGVSCDRSSVVPDSRDDRVARQLGVKLYLSDPHDVIASLSLENGGYVIRQVSGKWSADDERAILDRLTLFNSRLPKPKPAT